MRIVICVHNLANGGAERVAVLWAKGFAADGNEVHLITCEPDSRVDYDIPSTIRCHSIYCEGNPFSRYFGKVLKLRHLLKELHPNVALAVLHPWNIWLLMASFGLNIPIINTEHDSFERPVSAPMSLSAKIDKFYLNRFCSGVTVLTEADGVIARKHLKRVFVMPNPLAFSPVEKLPSKKKNIISAGRLDEWYCKGFDVLIRSWGIIAAKYPEWKLIIAGGGDEQSVSIVNNLIAENGLTEQISLVGFRKDIMNLFREASIFVLSSRYEGFGLVLIEAMSQGCACVACDYNGRQREIIRNQEEGLLCNPDDVVAMSRMIEKLINDESLRINIQNNAIERSQAFSLEGVTERWYEIFRELNINM